jgi:predicted DNA-binding WGR domain protein
MAKKKAPIKKKKKKSIGAKGQSLLVVLVICAVLFAPTTLILVIGMLPTIVAAFADRSNEGMRGITIGSINLAGCMPYVLDLWMNNHTLENAVVIITQVENLVVMWLAATIGYCLEWVVTGAVSVYMTDRANARILWIEKRQDELIKRWGRKVTGEFTLNEDGFPIDEEMVKAAERDAEKKADSKKESDKKNSSQ